jgi:hypothetical protein
MEIADFDGDGRLDIRLSDRDTICQTCSADQRRYDLRGVRLLLHPVPPTPVSSTWQSVTIVAVGQDPDIPDDLRPKARWFCSTPDHRTIAIGSADEGTPNTNTLQKWHLGDDGKWSLVAELDPGANVGWEQACAIGDLDGDGVPDLVLTFSHADGSVQFVVWMRGLPDGTYEQGVVSGPDGCKGDNVQIMQIAGRTVIVTSEQGCSGGTTPPAAAPRDRHLRAEVAAVTNSENLQLLERGDGHPEAIEQAIRELVGERPFMQLHVTENGRVPIAQLGNIEVVGDNLDDALRLLGVRIASTIREIEAEAAEARAEEP